MEARRLAIIQQEQLVKQHKEQTENWKHDTGALFDVMQRHVRKVTVDMEQLIMQTGLAAMQNLQAEKEKMFQEADSTSARLIEMIRQNEEDLKATNDYLKLEPDELASKMASGEISADYTPQICHEKLKIPSIDASPFIEMTDRIRQLLEVFKRQPLFNVTKEEKITALNFTDPAEEIQQGSTLDCNIISQWNQADGVFGLTLWKPEVEGALRKFSMQARLTILNENLQNYESLGQDPVKGDQLIASVNGSMVRAKVIGLRAAEHRVRVKLIDYGTLEALHYNCAYPWPSTLSLGKNEPAQAIDCSILGAVENPRDPRYNDARWFFGQTVQGVMNRSAGSKAFKVTFKEQVTINEEPVWVVDLQCYNTANRLTDFSAEIKKKLPEDTAKAAIHCRDIRYKDKEIVTTFISPSEKKAAEDAAKEAAEKAANTPQKPQPVAKAPGCSNDVPAKSPTPPSPLSLPTTPDTAGKSWAEVMEIEEARAKAKEAAADRANGAKAEGPKAEEPKADGPKVNQAESVAPPPHIPQANEEENLAAQAPLPPQDDEDEVLVSRASYEQVVVVPNEPGRPDVWKNRTANVAREFKKDYKSLSETGSMEREEKEEVKAEDVGAGGESMDEVKGEEKTEKVEERKPGPCGDSNGVKPEEVCKPKVCANATEQSARRPQENGVEQSVEQAGVEDRSKEPSKPAPPTSNSAHGVSCGKENADVTPRTTEQRRGSHDALTREQNGPSSHRRGSGTLGSPTAAIRSMEAARPRVESPVGNLGRRGSSSSSGGQSDRSGNGADFLVREIESRKRRRGERNLKKPYTVESLGDANATNRRSSVEHKKSESEKAPETQDMTDFPTLKLNNAVNHVKVTTRLSKEGGFWTQLVPTESQKKVLDRAARKYDAVGSFQENIPADKLRSMIGEVVLAKISAQNYRRVAIVKATQNGKWDVREVDSMNQTRVHPVDIRKLPQDMDTSTIPAQGVYCRLHLPPGFSLNQHAQEKFNYNHYDKHLYIKVVGEASSNGHVVDVYDNAGCTGTSINARMAQGTPPHSRQRTPTRETTRTHPQETTHTPTTPTASQIIPQAPSAIPPHTPPHTTSSNSAPQTPQSSTPQTPPITIPGITSPTTHEDWGAEAAAAAATVTANASEVDWAEECATDSRKVVVRERQDSMEDWGSENACAAEDDWLNDDPYIDQEEEYSGEYHREYNSAENAHSSGDNAVFQKQSPPQSDGQSIEDVDWVDLSSDHRSVVDSQPEIQPLMSLPSVPATISDTVLSSVLSSSPVTRSNIQKTEPGEHRETFKMCFVCKEGYHRPASCPKREKFLAENPCKWCRRPGHFVFDCPQKTPQFGAAKTDSRRPPVAPKTEPKQHRAGPKPQPAAAAKSEAKSGAKRPLGKEPKPTSHKCKGCGDISHYLKACPKREEYLENHRCGHCGGKHFQRDCKALKANPRV